MDKHSVKGGSSVSDDKNEAEYMDNVMAKARDAKIVRKIVLIIISSLTLILLISVFSSYMYIKSALKPVDPNSKEEITIEIPMGSSTSDIANILKENGIIKNSKVFRLYIKFKNQAQFQAGEYTLNPSLSLNEIVHKLQTGKVIEEPIFTITIPEGKTVDQIAEIFSSKLSFSKKEFMKKANDLKYIEELIALYPNLLSETVLDKGIHTPLEGYLFATTYEFYDEDPTVDDVLSMMLDKSNEVLTPLLEDMNELNFSVHEVLTLASIVERESKFSEDRPKVAQVFLNRLENNMKLQSDITAAYASGEHKVVMTHEDISIKSPYNTYVVDKLPIGPINSPSLESIKAVIEPEGEDFTAQYFYARPSGETLYSNSLDEHNNVKEKYEKEWHELEKAAKSKNE